MWKDNLKGDRTEWLLEPSDPSIRYWALKDLLDLEEDDLDVVAAWDAIMESPIVTSILGAMNPEGYWENPDDMYLPKYTASTHQLLILAELGARRTPEIEKAVEHIFRFQRNSGHFLTKLPKNGYGLCDGSSNGKPDKTKVNTPVYVTNTGLSFYFFCLCLLFYFWGFW